MIRHTSEEWARVTAMAAHLGISVPAFYERAAFVGDAQAAVELSQIHDELYGVRRLLGKAGVNLNQIARGVNSDGVLDARQLMVWMRMFERGIAELSEVLASLPRQPAASEWRDQ